MRNKQFLSSYIKSIALIIYTGLFLIFTEVRANHFFKSYESNQVKKPNCVSGLITGLVKRLHYSNQGLVNLAKNNPRTIHLSPEELYYLKKIYFLASDGPLVIKDLILSYRGPRSGFRLFLKKQYVWALAITQDGKGLKGMLKELGLEFEVRLWQELKESGWKITFASHIEESKIYPLEQIMMISSNELSTPLPLAISKVLHEVRMTKIINRHYEQVMAEVMELTQNRNIFRAQEILKYFIHKESSDESQQVYEFLMAGYPEFSSSKYEKVRIMPNYEVLYSGLRDRPKLAQVIKELKLGQKIQFLKLLRQHSLMNSSG